MKTMQILLFLIGDDIIKALKRLIDDFQNNPKQLFIGVLTLTFTYFVVNKLYKHAQKNDPELSRKKSIHEFVNENRELIQNNRIEKTFENLIESKFINEDNYYFNQIITLSNRFKILINEESKKKASNSIERNRIILALLNLLDELQKS